VHADLDILMIVRYCAIGDLFGPRLGPGRHPSAATPNWSAWPSPKSCSGSIARHAGCGSPAGDWAICFPTCPNKRLCAAAHLVILAIDMGPDGGHIVASGTPEDVARAPDSVTGPWLAEHLGLPDARQPGVLAVCAGGGGGRESNPPGGGRPPQLVA
jgi:hypothetical protein